MKKTFILLSSFLLLDVQTPTGAHAEEQPADERGQDAPSEQEIAESLKKLVFVPHDSGAPAVTDAGGVRAVSVLPKVELLAPERMALTLSPMPTLYWYISKAAEGTVRFTFLADDPAVIDPLLELEIDGIDREGIYAVSLEDHGLTLQPGQRYIWSIALSFDSESFGSDLVAQTVMQHSAAPDLAKALADIRPADRAVQLAADGYWYDAVDVLSAQIGQGDADPWQHARAGVLDQAGLLLAARYDQQKASKTSN